MRTRYLAIALALIATAALAGPEQSPAVPQGVALAAPPRQITDFTLTDQDAKPWRFSSLRGAPALVFFGFAHCPDICPTTLTTLQQLEKAAPEELAGMRIVLVSVDGERDTPAVLKSYLARFSPRFIGLTGAPSEVTRIAAQFPAVFFKGIPPKPGADYAVQHTSEVYALDAQGRVRARFRDAAIESMIAELRTLR
jgi:protein SCO1/2